jgi:predicted nucleic acid-binding protein
LIAYPDTSFLVPLYLVDKHTAKAQQQMARQPVVVITAFHRAELTHAIYQHVFRRQISLDEARVALANFERDCLDGIWAVASQPEQAFRTCAEVARRHVAVLGTRTLDSLHVASAIDLKADSFWTFDERQKRLAEAEGLRTY